LRIIVSDVLPPAILPPGATRRDTAAARVARRCGEDARIPPKPDGSRRSAPTKDPSLWFGPARIGVESADAIRWPGEEMRE
jgi:hypothetical protein